MWIIPKQLSAFVPDTADLNWGLNSLGSMCEQSLMWRSKPSRSATWLQRWRRVKWFRLLCGRILKPSRQRFFVEEYTASLPVILASRFLPQENEKELTIRDTFGRLYASTSTQLDLFGASSKTSQDTSGWDSTRFTKTFERWVTLLRQDSLRRQKSARLTSENDCLSWPTIRASDGEHGGPNQRDSSGKPALPMAVQNWRTPNGPDGEGGIMENLPGKDGHYKLRDQVNWKTPKTPTGGAESRASRASRGSGGEDLAAQVTSWPTSRQAEYKGCGPKGSKSQIHRLKRDYLDATVEELDGRPAQDKSSTTGSPRAQLNPDWVETLMGIPVGWTAFDFAETE